APAEIAALPPDLQNQMQQFRIAHRRIARSSDTRTLIAAVVPKNTACEVNASTIYLTGYATEATKLYLCALLNSFVLDVVIRQKVATTLNMFYLYSLPIPRLSAGNPYFDAIVPRAARLVCTRPEFAPLWESVMGTASPPTSPLVPLSVHGEGMTGTSPSLRAERGSGLTGGSGGEVDRERQRLRDEIDALVAHLYGLSRDDYAHILASFPLVFPDTDAGHIRMAAVLAAYDAAG
ncbi:MAG TPA: hypothetical protein VER79_05130, partial [Candidatus Limnocylindrales bacterium]|nr:hypothetical protein [Candidatus Limnocylindrales bacterium]